MVNGSYHGSSGQWVQIATLTEKVCIDGLTEQQTAQEGFATRCIFTRRGI